MKSEDKLSKNRSKISQVSFDFDSKTVAPSSNDRKVVNIRTRETVSKGESGKLLDKILARAKLVDWD